MGTFTSDWLDLREPADTIARSVRLVRRLDERLAGHAVIRALDLGTGTGANVRFLRNRLSQRQDWLLVDDDSQLLEEARVRCSPVEVRQLDLQAELASEAAGVFADQHLVTASALLDLVSERWLRGLASKCRAARAAVLFALTYDGEIRCTPAEPVDEEIRELVNGHQRTDKGFGPALGPDSAHAAIEAFGALGYHVEVEQTPWVLPGPSDSDFGLPAQSLELQRQLINGWAAAASEMAPHRLEQIDSWRMTRLAHVSTGGSQLIVGHLDLVAWLPR